MNRFYDNFNLLEQKDDGFGDSDYLDKYNSTRNKLFSPPKRIISVMIESDHTQTDQAKLRQLKQSNKIIKNVIGYTLNSVSYDYNGKMGDNDIMYKPYSRVDIILPDLPDNHEVISNLYEYNIIGSVDINITNTNTNESGSISLEERIGAGSNYFYPIDVDIKKLKVQLLFKDPNQSTPNQSTSSDEMLYDMNKLNPHEFIIRNIKLTLTTITNIKSINN